MPSSFSTVKTVLLFWIVRTPFLFLFIFIFSVFFFLSHLQLFPRDKKKKKHRSFFESLTTVPWWCTFFFPFCDVISLLLLQRSATVIYRVLFFALLFYIRPLLLGNRTTHTPVDLKEGKRKKRSTFLFFKLTSSWAIIFFFSPERVGKGVYVLFFINLVCSFARAYVYMGGCTTRIPELS